MSSPKKSKYGRRSPPKSPHSCSQSEPTTGHSEQAQGSTAHQTAGQQLPAFRSESLQGQATGTDDIAEQPGREVPQAEQTKIDQNVASVVLAMCEQVSRIGSEPVQEMATDNVEQPAVRQASEGEGAETVLNATIIVLAVSALLINGAGLYEMKRLLEMESIEVIPQLNLGLLLFLKEIRSSQSEWFTLFLIVLSMEQITGILSKIVDTVGSARLVESVHHSHTVIDGRIRPRTDINVNNDTTARRDGQSGAEMEAERLLRIAQRAGPSVIAEVAHHAGAEAIARLPRIMAPNLLATLRQLAPNALITEIMQRVGRELINDVAVRALPVRIERNWEQSTVPAAQLTPPPEPSDGPPQNRNFAGNELRSIPVPFDFRMYGSPPSNPDSEHHENSICGSDTPDEDKLNHEE